MIHFLLPFSHLRRLSQKSERDVAEASTLSRGAVRQLCRPETANLTCSSINQIAEHFNREVDIVMGCPEIFSEYSTVAVIYKIERDGFDSWKTHLFDLVDEFRRTADTRLILLPPPASADTKIIALLNSTVRALCNEVEITPPSWALRRHFLSTPWFLAGMNSLKASALLESPLPFRANNIFVHSNFLERA